MKQRVVYFVLFCFLGWICLFLFLAQKADAFQLEDAVFFEERLAADDLISYFELRKQIETLTFDGLEALSRDLEPPTGYPLLTETIRKVINERMDESIFLLQEDLSVNNVPHMINEPFYDDAQVSLINELNVEAEYLYFANQHYQYRKNDLIKKDPMWWISPALEKGAHDTPPDEGIRSLSKVKFIHEEHSEENPALWSHAFSFNHLTNFITSFRQWIKKYQEPRRMVLFKDDSIVFRDHYRLYGLDRSSGLLQWSFAPSDDSNKEHYQTLYPPHQNKESYEIEIAEDKIFAEVNSSLIALETKTRSLIWQYPLGAFTLCTKPIKVNNLIIAGIINSRGEIWFVGIDIETGKRRWESYLGMSSFLSPVSTLSFTEGRNVFIATNHGALINILADSGKIQWIRKYVPQKYNLIRYWEKAHYKNNYVGEGVIAYKGKFLIPFKDTLYYKPRESNYIYSIDKTTGELKDELYIPPLEYTTIGIVDGILVLAQVNENRETQRIIFMDCKTNKELGNIELPESGPLMGVVQMPENDLYFKLGNTIYSVISDENSVECRPIATAAEASKWLIAADDWSLITADNKECTYYTRKDNQKNSPDGAYEAVSSYKASLNRLMDMLDGVIHQKKEFEATISLLKRKQIPFEVISEKIITMIERRQENDAQWLDPFLRSLSEIYPHVSVVYRDVTMDFQHLLEAISVMPEKEPQEHTGKIFDQNDQTIDIRGENAFIQPFIVIKGDDPTDFFLMLNRDQLLCVEESGRIRWDTKIFYQPRMETVIDNYESQQGGGRLYGDDVSAYLFKDVMIINDRVNIVALNVHNGKHVWSMTNEGELFDDEKILSAINDDEIFKKYSISPSFVKNIMYKLQFSGEDIFVVHQDNIKKMDPRTGIVTAQKKIKQEDIFDLFIGENYLFAVSTQGDEVSIINLSDLSVETIPLTVADKKPSFRQCTVIGDRLVLNIDDALIYVDGKSKKSEKFFSVNENKRTFLESYQDKLVVITPFQSIRCFEWSSNRFEKKWAFQKPLLRKVIFSSPPKEFVTPSTHYYFIKNGRIIFPIRHFGKYTFKAFDLAYGDLLWETEPLQIHGLFYYMSNPIISDGSLFFILSTIYFGDDESSLVPERTVSHTKSSLFKIKYDNGDIEKEHKFSGISGFRRGFYKTSLFRTRDRLLYGLYGLYIRSLEGER